MERSQLLGLGVSSGTLSRWISTGWVIRLHPRVYALGHTALTERGRLRAALLYAGPDSLLSHRTGAFLRKLVDRNSPVIHVTTPNQVRSVHGILIHRPREIHASLVNDLPTTSVARTLVDVAPDCADWELRKALARADYQGELQPAELRAVTGRGRPGSRRLRGAIERHMPELAQTLSVLEDRFLLLCEAHSISMPLVNARVRDFFVDALWPREMVVVEVDGSAAHSSPTQRRRDAERDMELRSRGYLVLRYTWWQVTQQGDAVAAELHAALRARHNRSAQRSE